MLNLSFADNAANTTDQSVALTATAIDPNLTAPGAPVQSLHADTALTVKSPVNLSTIPVDLKWTASPTAGVDTYEIQQSDNGGAFSPVATASPGALTTTVNVAMGTLSAPGTHQWRVRGCTGVTARHARSGSPARP